MMTEKAKAIINRKLNDLNDDIHDLYCTLREDYNLQILPTDYVKYVREVLIVNLIRTAQDLCDEFDEEVDD